MYVSGISSGDGPRLAVRFVWTSIQEWRKSLRALREYMSSLSCWASSSEKIERLEAISGFRSLANSGLILRV